MIKEQIKETVGDYELVATHHIFDDGRLIKWQRFKDGVFQMQDTQDINCNYFQSCKQAIKDAKIHIGFIKNN